MKKTVLPRALRLSLDQTSGVPYSKAPATLSDEQRSAFLDLVAQGEPLHRAASTAGVPYWRIAIERRRDPEFDALVAEVAEVRTQLMVHAVEDKLLDQALNGYEEDIYHQGIPVGTRVVYGTNGNAQFILKGLKPDVYGTQRTESTVQVSQGPPPAVRNDADAQKLLSKMHAELRGVIEGQFTEVRQLPPNDGSDLL